MTYRVEYSPDAVKHLRILNARQRATILDVAAGQLTQHPTVETRNRRRMRPNPLAPWALRVGNLRVYYDVQHSPDAVVFILAIGVKRRNVLYVGKEAILL